MSKLANRRWASQPAVGVHYRVLGTASLPNAAAEVVVLRAPDGKLWAIPAPVFAAGWVMTIDPVTADRDTARPYLTQKTVRTTRRRRYNPNYGDARVCVCGHEYHRHFDTYDVMADIGCKYCPCRSFVEQGVTPAATAPPPQTPTPFPPPRRTRSAVLRDRLNPHVGCCNRYADRQACACLGDAEDDLGGVSAAVYFDRLKCGLCLECGGSGYAVHPRNGQCRDSRRCSRGCAVQCSICSDPDCTNPGGQH